jgi:hypothetical protein
MMTDRQLSRYQAFLEIALIFAVFCIQGAWPVPDVNEPHYLGKAIHYWNPDWLRGDFFMESTDTHKVFYFTFGWLSLWLGPVALIWTGRILTWLLLAWSWRRLSVAVLPRAWWSVLTAALFVCLMDRCHMAGEWVIGGVEAKGFAYVFVFLGLESLVRNRWNWALVLFGAAAAFHVLVGGWAAIAAGIAWLVLPSPGHRREALVGGRGAGGEGGVLQEPAGPLPCRPPLRSLWPGILGGMLLALPGLWPAVTLDWNVDSKIVQQAHQIYVFERLPHHLVITGIRPEFIARLVLLWVFWLLLPKIFPGGTKQRQLRAFVTGAVVITCAGVVLQLLILLDRAMAADLLRYYWFRLTDVALPLAVALEGTAMIARTCRERPVVGRRWFVLALVVVAVHLGDRTWDRIFPAPPRSHRLPDFQAWRKACEWVAHSGQIPPTAKFLTPRLTQTFKWYTGHSDVATWKDVPQNSQAVVQWWERVQDIFATGVPPPEQRWYEPLAEEGLPRLRELGAKYGADYAVSELTAPPLDLPVVYRNRTYIIYRLR